MAFAYLKVVEVMGGGDFNRSAAFGGVGMFICYYFDFAVEHRDGAVLAYEFFYSGHLRGGTAMAVSPAMVSGRVVATTTSPPPSIL